MTKAQEKALSEKIDQRLQDLADAVEERVGKLWSASAKHEDRIKKQDRTIAIQGNNQKLAD